MGHSCDAGRRFESVSAINAKTLISTRFVIEAFLFLIGQGGNLTTTQRLFDLLQSDTPA